MHQNQLFIEDEYDAIRQTVAALGGAKSVGAKLYPTKSPDKAGEHLLNALNPNHAQKLGWSEGLLIMEWGRAEGVHICSNYIGSRMSYRFESVEPEEVKDVLMREYIDAAKLLSKISGRIDEAENAIKLKSVG